MDKPQALQQTYKIPGKEKDIMKQRRKDRKTERKGQRQKDRKTEKQKDRKTERKRERGKDRTTERKKRRNKNATQRSRYVWANVSHWPKRAKRCKKLCKTLISFNSTKPKSVMFWPFV